MRKSVYKVTLAAALLLVIASVFRGVSAALEPSIGSVSINSARAGARAVACCIGVNNPEMADLTYTWTLKVDSGEDTPLGTTEDSLCWFTVPTTGTTFTVGVYITTDTGVQTPVTTAQKTTVYNTVPMPITAVTVTATKANATATATCAAATDANGDALSYYWQMRVDNGEWRDIACALKPMCQYVVPVGTTYCLRVKAKDEYGGETEYIQSMDMVITADRVKPPVIRTEGTWTSNPSVAIEPTDPTDPNYSGIKYKVINKGGI